MAYWWNRLHTTRMSLLHGPPLNIRGIKSVRMSMVTHVVVQSSSSCSFDQLGPTCDGFIQVYIYFVIAPQTELVDNQRS